MEKIRINLTKNSLNKLENDMILFEFLKDDNSINKNKFINTLIVNYFPTFDKEADSHIEKYSKVISLHLDNKKLETEIVNDLLANDHLFSFSKSDNLISYLSFKPNKSTLRIVNIIEHKYLSYQSLSSFFRNMIEEYLLLPQYEREKIIYKENYEMIKDCIDSEIKMKVYLKSGANREISPFKVTTNKEEIFNYLLGVENNNTIVSFHLSRIDYIYKINEKINIKDALKTQLEEVIKNGAQFPYSKQTNSIIELTKEGKRLYKRKYLNRPSVIKIEDSNYYFNCSLDQLLIYFFPFGKEAKIISPSWLKSKIKKAYLEAYNNYDD